MVRLKDFPASLWKRTIAYAIDLMILLFVVEWSFLKIIQTSVSQNENGFSFSQIFQTYSATSSSQLIIATITITILSILYWSILEYKLQQSVGKILMRIRVRSEFKTLTFTQCIIRSVTKVELPFLFLDSIFILFNIKRQRFFERLSKTQVVEDLTNIKL